MGDSQQTKYRGNVGSIYGEDGGNIQGIRKYKGMRMNINGI